MDTPEKLVLNAERVAMFPQEGQRDLEVITNLDEAIRAVGDNVGLILSLPSIEGGYDRTSITNLSRVFLDRLDQIAARLGDEKERTVLIEHGLQLMSEVLVGYFNNILDIILEYKSRGEIPPEDLAYTDSLYDFLSPGAVSISTPTPVEKEDSLFDRLVIKIVSDKSIVEKILEVGEVESEKATIQLLPYSKKAGEVAKDKEIAKKALRKGIFIRELHPDLLADKAFIAEIIEEGCGQWHKDDVALVFGGPLIDEEAAMKLIKGGRFNFVDTLSDTLRKSPDFVKKVVALVHEVDHIKAAEFFKQIHPDLMQNGEFIASILRESKRFAEWYLYRKDSTRRAEDSIQYLATQWPQEGGLSVEELKTIMAEWHAKHPYKLIFWDVANAAEAKAKFMEIFADGKYRLPKVNIRLGEEYNHGTPDRPVADYDIEALPNALLDDADVAVSYVKRYVARDRFDLDRQVDSFVVNREVLHNRELLRALGMPHSSDVLLHDHVLDPAYYDDPELKALAENSDHSALGTLFRVEGFRRNPDPRRGSYRYPVGYIKQWGIGEKDGTQS